MKFKIIIEVNTEKDTFSLKIKDAAPKDDDFNLEFHTLMSSYLDRAAETYRETVKKLK